MFTFDSRRALHGFAIGLVVAGALGLPLVIFQRHSLPPAIYRAQSAKWLVYFGLGGTILIWRKRT